MDKPPPDKAFDWYQTIVDLGKFEVEHGRTRFYETAKLHLAIVGGVLALASYATTSGEHAILFLASFVAVFGAVNACAWIRQIHSSANWEDTWYGYAGMLEETEDFRNAVGARSVKAWSSDEVKARLLVRAKRTGRSQGMYVLFIRSLIFLYILLAVLTVLYGRYGGPRWARWC